MDKIKNVYDTLTQLAIFILIAIAAIVAIGLSNGENMWRWIIGYWVALTIKNAIDLWSFMYKKEKEEKNRGNGSNRNR